MSVIPSNRDVETPPDPPLPEISGYRLSRVIGNGGMSTVYAGEQVSLGREVAIKVMLPEALADEVSRRRFENEARTIARLEHPHIVGIYEVGRTRDGLPYYAMPYLPRGHLGQRDFTKDHARVRSTLRALLTALDFAHARGVVHRDVKAENVLFDEAQRPLLADFGIALRRGFGPRVTTAGLAVGSTAYMAPEQARGGQVDQRADLYSVGVLGWEMLTGRLPYAAGDALSMAVMHAQDPIPRLPRELRHWQRFLDKALAKSPSQRYRTAQQMLEAMERVPQRGGQPLTLALAGARHRVAAIRRWPKGAWIGLLLVSAATAGIALRQFDAPQGDSFFRARSSDASTLPVPGAQPGQSVVGDPMDSMLRAPPESAAERFLVAAEQQIRARNLTAPKGNNAYDSLVAGWQADASHARMPVAIGSLIDAFGNEAGRRLQDGDDARAREYLDHANRLAVQTRQTDSVAVKRMRDRVGKALESRIERAAASYDRSTALQVAKSARALGLPAASVEAFNARARKIPQAGDSVPGDPVGSVLVRSGNTMLAAARSEISRGDYARFAAATGRPATLCRERTSLLRIVAPRSWQSPGFTQSPNQPVVCVSWSDADAYARWLSQRSGHHYRLPNTAEARALAAGGGAKPVAEWLSECSEGCRKRFTTGQSWRGTSGARPLDPARGYDDVGFRLVRDL